MVKPGRGYPGIEDYVGFDDSTGTLTHLHVHYQLTLGEKFLKGHRLPWEQLYLDTRVFDERHGLYVTDPGLELIVLVVRQAMKLRLRDRVHGWLGTPFFRGGMLREFRWLAERVDPERVRVLAASLLGEHKDSLAIHFFYINVGDEKKPKIARVDVPLWVVNNKDVLNNLHCALIEQAKIMGNEPFPYLLHRAHEIAVVTHKGKEEIDQMLSTEIRNNGGEVREKSGKQSAKDLPGRTKR